MRYVILFMNKRILIDWLIDSVLFSSVALKLYFFLLFIWWFAAIEPELSCWTDDKVKFYKMLPLFRHKSRA